MNKITKLVAIISVVLFMTAPVYAGEAYWTDQNGTRLDSLRLGDGEAVIRLVSDIPEGKSLQAYSFVVMYNEACVEAGASTPQTLTMPPININANTPGEIVANAFDLDGAKGKASLIDLKVKGICADDSYISVLFSGFGASADDQFKPDIAPLKISK
jgi:hypothetical protein